MPPRISILIPTYNRAALLKDALDSVLSQTLRASQVLVIDDGSTDETPAFLKSVGTTIECIRVPQGGKSSALNAGLQRVSGDYIWIFDDDDIAEPDALERFVEPLEQDATLGFSYSHYWYTPGLGDGQLGTPKGMSRIPDVKSRGFLVPLLEFNFLSGASIFARTPTYTTVGAFDPQLTRSQEYEMAIRIARRFRGAQVRGGPTFHLRLHSGSRGSESDRFRADAKKKKWLEYDQLIFKNLRRELRLEEYLPPGLHVDTHRRTALLQRAVVMAGKSLFSEALDDFGEIATNPPQSPLDEYEARLVEEQLSSRPFYGGGLRSSPQTMASLRRMSRGSVTIASVCSHLRTVILREMVSTNSGNSADRAMAIKARLGFMSRLAMEFARLSRVVP